MTFHLHPTAYETQTCLSAFEAARFATLAEAARGRSDGGEDAFKDASEAYVTEVRACYVAADQGDFDAYLKEANEIFETEWNSYGEEV